MCDLIGIGLDYVSLDRETSTLSGGECQRLKLAKEFNKKGNTVVVIEHNVDVMRNADWLVDMGIDGGIRGGQILFEGKPMDLLMCQESITAKYIGR